MASSTQVMMIEEMSVQLSLEEKASLEEITKEAESALESQEVLNQPLATVAQNNGLGKQMWFTVYVAAGILKNQTKGPLNVMASHIYAGRVFRNFPNPLTGTGAFAISSISDKGDEAGVVYTDKNNAWLLAFVNDKANGMRIYGECGKKSKFVNIDWTKVEKKLLNAGKDVKIYDPATGTSLQAGIRGCNHKAVVGAIFLG